MKFDRLEIRGLFDSFHYDIDFKNGANPFIITGLNGYGKTTILTIIDSIAEKDLYYFYTLPFTSIDMYFEDGCCLKISSRYIEKEQQIGIGSDTKPSKVLKFNYISTNGSPIEVVFDEEKITKAVENLRYRENLSGYSIISSEFYRKIKEMKEMKEDGRLYKSFLKEIDKGIEVLFIMLESFGATFIEAQRILIDSSLRKEKNVILQTIQGSNYSHKIQDIAGELGNTLRGERFRYLTKAQEIDTQFIDQLLQDEKPLETQEYTELKRDLDGKIKELVSYGLLDPIAIKDYEIHHPEILSVYIRNLKKKLDIYDPILNKLRLFSDMISSLEFINKRVSFRPRKGICVEDKKGTPIDITKLSSGEQNEIVMLYFMIFKVPDNKLLLIDEPEISLHVRWQNGFLDDLSYIAKTKSLQVIVATHSPHIIGGRWRESYDLCENMICKDEC